MRPSGNRLNIPLFFLVMVLSFSRLNAQEQAFGLIEKPGQYLPEEVFVLNEDSVEVNINDLLDKPGLLCFVYYHCPTLCPKMLEGIAELVNYSKAIPGKDYQIFVVSIDPSETKSLANSAKKYYIEQVTRSTDPYFWRFFTADSASIRKLTEAVGWEYRQIGNDFVHTTSSILLTPNGMISQYFYGTYFNYMHFDMSLEKAWSEQVSPTRIKKLKYCYNYQPGKNANIEIVTKVFGILVILLALGLFFFLLKEKKIREKT